MQYRIKRFSTYQKEFGIFRRMMEKTIKKENRESYERNMDLFLDPTVENDEVEEKIISDYKDIAKIQDKKSDMKHPRTKPQNYTPDEETLLMLLMNKNDKKICDIYWNKCDGLESLAHELGHVKNYRGNFLDRFIRKGANFGNALNGDEEPGVIRALLTALGSNFVNWEEQNASKKGYELLKSYDLSPQELKRAKENLDNAIKLYKSQNKIFWRQKLINSKIPKWLL